MKDRVFHFSFDERVYASDVAKIVAAAREFPNSKIFCHEPSWSGEGQTFVLAETAEEAAKILKEAYGEGDSEAKDFSLGDQD